MQLPEWDVTLPPSDRRAALKRQIDDWIRSPELHRLAQSFGSLPPNCGTAELLDWLDAFSGREWDFRGGRERNLAERPSIDDDQSEAAVKAADALGLLSSPGPSLKNYDYCLILGGLVRACVTRPRYAAELVQSGTCFGQLVALGGFRFLGGNEMELATRIGITADNEFGAMDAGVRIAFDMKEVADVKMGDGSCANHDWRINEYSDRKCQVIAAPSSEPATRRANSADTFVWWANRTEGLSGAHVLLITNPIYVPYQGAAATQILGLRYDVDVETVGITPAATDLGGDTQVFEPSNYLQEIRSGIRGMRSLHEALA